MSIQDEIRRIKEAQQAPATCPQCQRLMKQQDIMLSTGVCFDCDKKNDPEGWEETVGPEEWEEMVDSIFESQEKN